MAWRIISTTDSQHVGETLDVVEKGNIITFSDGDVVIVNEVFLSDDGGRIIVSSPNYQMTLCRE